MKKNVPLSFSISYKDSATSTSSGTIGVLSLEVASLMSKIVRLWQSLGNDNITKLRYDIFNHEGIRKLISDNHDSLFSLALSEFMDSLGSLTQSVARLGSKCADPVLQQFDRIFTYLLLLKRNNDNHLYGFQYAEKKMERKVKKMGRIASATSNLYQELEALGELEQTLRRMKIQAKSDPSRRSPLADLKPKVVWQRKEVNHLRDKSLWNHTYDYTVRLLARSLFTVLGRINHVFAFLDDDHGGDDDDDENLSPSIFLLSPTWKRRNWKKTKWPVSNTPFSGCIPTGADSPVLPGFVPKMSNADRTNNWNKPYLSFFESQHKPLKSAPSTLGAAALALRYANVIILIKKLASSPDWIVSDARDELYSMLPSSIRASLRARLRPYTRNPSTCFDDPIVAAYWSKTTARILEWLAPLAHNMIRWQSERTFEQKYLVCSSNILLLQTLYFADQAKAEAAITELLVGLNYLWRFRRETNEKQN
ncbi:uncharacterized protein A4U43_C02F8790 [Asparagus officinalis]|uniref:DUF668 domain-containing protein n=2 Tax=Asparagus officinalis TaxID=4686 RepID=A0A5P1FH36_ASPOF|nr:uncharacterized protein A4U43_C02F8790 [Asparagus officinalis]